MKLDRYSSTPLYAQLRELIAERIRKGMYKEGQKIPSELEFCAELELSRPTVRQAIAELVSDGVLEIRQGRGTYVSESSERVMIPHFTALSFSFLNMSSYEKIGLKPISLLEANADLDQLFQVQEKKGHPGYWLAEWPLLMQEQLVGLCRSYIPVQWFPELGQAIGAGKRMVDIKSNKYACLPVKGSLSLCARPARNPEAEALEIPRRSVILALEGPLHARNGYICEALRIVLRPDLIGLEIN